MTSIEEEWEKFCEDEDSFVPVNNILDQTETKEIPKCGNIYISTKTKIAYLDTKIPLQEIFWKIPVIKYYMPQEGVIKNK